MATTKKKIVKKKVAEKYIQPNANELYISKGETQKQLKRKQKTKTQKDRLMNPAFYTVKNDAWKGWKKRICIAVPTTGLVRVEWMMARFGQIIPCNWSNGDIFQYYDMYSPMGYAVAEARNICVEYFMAQGFEWLFFIDHDVLLPPDTFLKMTDYMNKKEYPVVCGLYYCKGSHPEPLIFRGRGNSYFTKWKQGDKVMVDGIPMGCFPAGTKIQTMSGYKSIETIKRGESVLTHKGQYKEVYEETIRDYKGKMIKIVNNKFNLPVELTEEHPILAVEGKYLSNGMLRKPTSAFRKYDKYIPEFIEAGKITEDHILLYPINQEIIDIDFILMSDYLKELSVDGDKVAYENKNKMQTKWFNDRVDISSDFMKLAGYYLSEGSSTDNYLKFSFNKNEEDYIQEVQALLKGIFEVESSLDLSNIENNGISIVVCSKVLSKLFAELFGKGAFNKHIKTFLLSMNLDLQKSLLEGLWHGDGFVSNKNRNRLGYVTVSENLALGIRDLLLRQGIIPSIRKSQYTGRDTFRYDLTVSGEDANKLRILFGLTLGEQDTKQGSLAWIDDGYVWLPVHSIENYDYEGKVFNLSVKDDESYCTLNFAVHNCTLIHRSVMEVLYHNSQVVTVPSLAGPVVVRKVFETPRKAWFDPQQGKYQSQSGTEDLFWCDRIKNEKVFERCGVKQFKKFQKMKYPYLLDTSIFCKHISENGQTFP